ncbi:10071_t:CDS:2 [Acaulospora colombiana]|uniref:10071_t:CDS:1 n=1 Tax=Acaulospora colombiana TaxID=27376 RepID=A0ACA9LKA5_9GLOM|nr:10071_t:CDS:2 [Acaulospora colombiana]
MPCPQKLGIKLQPNRGELVVRLLVSPVSLAVVHTVQDRGGRMFAPTKIWRKWHIKTNLNQKRFAITSALAASSIPSLVLARGHRIEEIKEVPLVVGDGIESLTKTKTAVGLLKSVKAHRDVVKVSNSLYNEDHGVVKAFRNIPGVELVNVRHLNLLQLAPGGHLGRFIIWSQGAFSLLDELFGTYAKVASLKKDYSIINSKEIQQALRPAGEKHQKRPWTQKKNPLRNNGVKIRLNPYAKVLRRAEIIAAEKRKAGKIKKEKVQHKASTKTDRK